MDSITIPSETVPAELRVGCEQILKRGKELKKAEPVVAYWCCFSAAQKAVAAPSRSSDGTAWLMSLLDALEQMKAVLGNNEAVTNEAAGAAYIENFALKIFMSADNDDRRGETGKATIRRFVVAGQFIEVLRCFENGMTEEMEQKLQYARWKAADGAKALREGRTPVSGPPMPEEDLDPFPVLPTDAPTESSASPPPGKPVRGSFSSSNRPTIPQGSPAGSGTPTGLSPAGNSKPSLPQISTKGETRTPQRNHSSASIAWSTVATPGLADDDEGEKRFDLPARNAADSPSPDRSVTPPGGDKKNVRFMGPDGAPLSPAQTHMSVDSYDAPIAPPPTTFSPSPPKSSAPLPSSTRPRSDSQSRDPKNGQGGTGRQRGDSNATLNGRPRSGSTSKSIPPPPPPSLVSYPSQPPVQPSSSGSGLSSPPPSAPPANSLGSSTAAVVGPPFVPNRKQIDQTQKHARWAISALDYDDFDTAKLELRKALAVLEGRGG